MNLNFKQTYKVNLMFSQEDLSKESAPIKKGQLLFLSCMNQRHALMWHKAIGLSHSDFLEL